MLVHAERGEQTTALGNVPEAGARDLCRTACPRSSTPSNLTEPLAVGGVEAHDAAQSVDFPIPFRPTTATDLSTTENVTFWSTWALP